MEAGEPGPKVRHRLSPLGGDLALVPERLSKPPEEPDSHDPLSAISNPPIRRILFPHIGHGSIDLWAIGRPVLLEERKTRFVGTPARPTEFRYRAGLGGWGGRLRSRFFQPLSCWFCWRPASAERHRCTADRHNFPSRGPEHRRGLRSGPGTRDHRRL